MQDLFDKQKNQLAPQLPSNLSEYNENSSYRYNHFSKLIAERKSSQQTKKFAKCLKLPDEIIIENISINKVIKRSDSVENFFTDSNNKIEKLKIFRKIVNRKKRQKLLDNNLFLKKITVCNSRSLLASYISETTNEWKNLLKKYIKDWLIFHLHLRQIKNFKKLMSHRQFLFESIDDPDILNDGLGLENNMIKNFCKGFVQYIAMYQDELIQEGFIKPF